MVDEIDEVSCMVHGHNSTDISEHVRRASEPSVLAIRENVMILSLTVSCKMSTDLATVAASFHFWQSERIDQMNSLHITTR